MLKTDMETLIVIKDLHKSFGSHRVLAGVNLDVRKGENLVILGKSGEGKSVTLKCISGLMVPDAGSVKVFDRDIAGLNEAELKNLRGRMGYLFQGSALYDSMTVRENLAFPLKRVLQIRDAAEIENRCRQVLEEVGLTDTLDKMPSELSGGMRKRLALARTLIVRPEIILYDEPTTGLDTITSKEISRLIVKMQKQYLSTSVIVTHDLACAKIIADRVVIMNRGTCMAMGSFDELGNSTDEFIRSFFN